MEFEKDFEDDKVFEDAEKEEDFPAVGSAGDGGEVDYEKVGQLKMDAATAAASGDLGKALDLYTEAIKLNPSALSYAKRAGK